MLIGPYVNGGAVIIGGLLGSVVGTRIPLVIVQVALATIAVYIFSCAGGLIMVATGLRICNIKPFPVANMLPGLLLVIPFSALWAKLFA